MGARKYWYSSLIAFTICVIAVVILLFYGMIAIPDLSQGTLSFVKDIVSFIVPIISFVVGTYYARKAMKFQQEIAPGKPEVKILLHGETLIPDSPEGIRDIVFGYSVEEDARVFCYIPLLIKNDGEVTAQDIHLRISFPKSMSTEKDVRLKETLRGFEKEAGFKRISEESEDSWIVDYVLPRLHPGDKFLTKELIDISGYQLHEFDVSAVTFDKVPITAKVEARFSRPSSSQVDVSLVGTDMKATSNFFVVKFCKSEDLQEIENRRFEQTAKEKTSEDLMRRAIIIIPNLKRIAIRKDTQEPLYIEQLSKSRIQSIYFGKVDTSLLTSLRNGSRSL